VLGQPRGERHRVNQSELQPEQRRPQQVGPDAELRVVPLPGGPVERREQGEPGPGGEVRAEEGGGEGPGPEACDEGELERDLESFFPRFFRFFFSCETFFPISVGRRSNSKLEKRKKRTKLSHHSDDRQEHRLPEGPDVVARGARAPGAHREEGDEEDDLFCFLKGKKVEIFCSLARLFSGLHSVSLSQKKKKKRTAPCTAPDSTEVLQNDRAVRAGLELYALGAASSVARCLTGLSSPAKNPAGSAVKNAL